MNLWSTTPVPNKSHKLRIVAWLSVAIMVLGVPAQFMTSQPVNADQYDAKIAALKQKISGYQKQSKALQKKSDSLKKTLEKLSNDQSKLQAEIDLKQAEYDKLTTEIKNTKAKIKENKQISGELIVDSSLSDDVPLIVRLAASEDLADYIDGEVNRSTVRDAIVEKTEENEKLKKVLEEKQDEVKQVLNEQKQKRSELIAKKSERRRVLDRTNNNQAEYEKLIKKSKGKVSSLLKQQQEAAAAALNGTQGATGGALSTSNYYWANSPTNYNNNCVSYTTGITLADDWGYCVRQCTSYVAWRLAKDGANESNFSYLGNANNWWGKSGVSAGSIPKNQQLSGYVIVMPTSTYGHVMYAERVENGKIKFTDYNGWGGSVSPGFGEIPLSTATNGYNFKVIKF